MLIFLFLFLTSIATSRCGVTEGCTGVLVPVSIRTVGLGGAIEILFACNGC